MLSIVREHSDIKLLSQLAFDTGNFVPKVLKVLFDLISNLQEDEGNLEIGTYRDFMERLFDEIPSLQDEEKKVEEDENVQNITSGWLINISERSYHYCQ